MRPQRRSGRAPRRPRTRLHPARHILLGIPTWCCVTAHYSRQHCTQAAQQLQHGFRRTARAFLSVQASLIVAASFCTCDGYRASERTQVCAAQLTLHRVEQLRRRRPTGRWCTGLVAPPLASVAPARSARHDRLAIVNPAKTASARELPAEWCAWNSFAAQCSVSSGKPMHVPGWGC